MDEVIEFDKKKWLVQQQPCFSGLADEDLSQLTDLFVQKNFKPEDVIVEEGDLVDSVYLIVSGKAEVRHERIKDGKLTYTKLATLGPDEAIGLNETGFYSLSGRRTATVAATTDMVTLKLSVAAFNGFALSSHRIKQAMTEFAKKIV